MECLILRLVVVLVWALPQLNFIKGQQFLPSCNEKCFNSSTAIKMIDDLKTMITCSCKNDQDEKHRLENATLSNTNGIQDLQTMVAELYERDEKLRLESENATLRSTNTIQDLRTHITGLQVKVTDLTDSTTKINARIRNIYDLLKLSEEGKVFIQNEKAYYVSDKRLSWYEAWSFCRSKDAVLVNILNSSMNRYITRILADYGEDFWIGGIRVSGVFSWKTDSGYSPITWFNWAPGEPGSSPKCIQLWKGQGHRWDDAHCTGR